MAFIDEITIYAEAGRGGDGVVRWRREKFVPKGGPAGGDAGRGGDFYVRAVRDIHILSKYKAKKEFVAGRGEDGGKKSLHGKSGEDYILDLPIGSIITKTGSEDISTGEEERWQLGDEGEKIMLLRGGYGGFGNEHFKSSTNVTPLQSREGQEGEKASFHIELELFADIGLIGLPNAGKSSLLNAITNADAKVADYAFTTLDPNLGDFYGYIIADIPGLIEGASDGKGRAPCGCAIQCRGFYGNTGSRPIKGNLIFKRTISLNAHRIAINPHLTLRMCASPEGDVRLQIPFRFLRKFRPCLGGTPTA